MQEDQTVTSVTIDWIFKELKNVYTLPWQIKDTEAIRELWLRELCKTPLRHIKFVFAVISVVDDKAFEKNPPSLLQIKNMWTNALRKNDLYNETKAFEAAVNRGWTSSPCIYPAIIKTGLDHFVTDSAHKVESEFRKNYVASVADFINGDKKSCLYPATQLKKEDDMNTQEHLEDLKLRFPERAEMLDKNNNEFQKRLASGEKGYDICKSMLPHVFHKVIERMES